MKRKKRETKKEKKMNAVTATKQSIAGHGGQTKEDYLRSISDETATFVPDSISEEEMDELQVRGHGRTVVDATPESQREFDALCDKYLAEIPRDRNGQPLTDPRLVIKKAIAEMQRREKKAA